MVLSRRIHDSWSFQWLIGLYDHSEKAHDSLLPVGDVGFGDEPRDQELGVDDATREKIAHFALGEKPGVGNPTVGFH